MNDDPKLRERLRELQTHEAAGAPSLDRVLRGPAPAPRPGWRRLAWVGAAAAVLIAAAIAIWPRPVPEELPEVSPAALADLESADWSAPTDALLADAGPFSANGTGAQEPGELFREINQLLGQPRPAKQ
jgi:hypothetical protein